MVRSLIGSVVSNKMMKSVTVAVTRVFRHPRLEKTVRETKKYMAHDELNACSPGDVVRLEESRPLSRRKRWTVAEVLRRERTFEPAAAAAASAVPVAAHHAKAAAAAPSAAPSAAS